VPGSEIRPTHLTQAGFVSAVRLEQAAPEVVGRSAADVLDEVPLQVARLDQPDVRAVPLNGPDPGERGDQRLRHP
jgi:hypothetical protein